jgi:tetratricopeptide (TPR) repeat protein
MRAREGLANCLWAAGRRDEAARHCREMLRLNPNDNQGIRYRLASMLLDLEQHDELMELLRRYENDSSADWTYTSALVAFRQEGDSEHARQLLTRAKQGNAEVPAYLSGARRLPRELPEFIKRGGEDEAICYAAQFLPSWKDSPGAIAWLRKVLTISPTAGRYKKRPSWIKIRQTLVRLPQSEGETWHVELRSLMAPPTSEHGSEQLWMLAIVCTSPRQVVRLEPFVDRPNDGEVWSVLIEALREPRSGEPRRPREICVSRKAWFRSWNSKLRDIGVDCRIAEWDAESDQWFAEASQQFEMAERMLGGVSAAGQDWAGVESLPQRPEETWQVGVERVPAWIEVAGEPMRPWVCLVAAVESDAILGTEIKVEEPESDWVLQGIWQALNRPAIGEPHRPGVIEVSSDALRDLLAEYLEGVGVRCTTNPKLAHVRRLVGELADSMPGKQQFGAMLKSPGVTPAQVGGLFEAAAEFYRSRPWRQIPGDTVIRVDCEKFTSGPWYAVVMGQSGIELGVALYEDVELLRTIIYGELPEKECGRRQSAISLTFGEAFEIPPEDLDAAERYGWPIAGPEAYPAVMRVNPGMALRTPLKWELELLEGCLRAMVPFVSDRSTKAHVPVPLSGETATFQLQRLDEIGVGEIPGND